MLTDTKILEIEFKGDNYMRLSNIAWMLLLINQIDNGYDAEFINEWLLKEGCTETALNNAIAIRNYDRKLLMQYAQENSINTNWLLEYKEIDPEEYHHLVKPIL
nr:hypothetical protein [Mucilaginibacter sp. E4BP6]